MFDLSKPTSPLAGMGLGQKIAAAALLLLALIAAIAFLAGGGSSGEPGGSPSGFTPQNYASGTSTGGSGGASHRSSSSGTGDVGDGLGTVALSDLPPEARHTVSLVDAGGPFPYPRDGIVFGNYDHVLPKHPSGWYHEYTVKTPGVSNRGVRRIVRGKDGTMYYTGDHYRTFERVER